MANIVVNIFTHMVARAGALRIDINTDGRLLPTKRRWRTSSKACAPHRLHACAPNFHLLVTSVQGVAMSTPAVMPFRFFVQTPIFSISPSSFSLSPIQ